MIKAIDRTPRVRVSPPKSSAVRMEEELRKAFALGGLRKALVAEFARSVRIIYTLHAQPDKQWQVLTGMQRLAMVIRDAELAKRRESALAPVHGATRSAARPPAPKAGKSAPAAAGVAKRVPAGLRGFKVWVAGKLQFTVTATDAAAVMQAVRDEFPLLQITSFHVKPLPPAHKQGKG